MRFRARRLFGVAALSLMIGLGTVGCSGDQQDDDDGVSADNNAAAGDDNASGEGNAATADDNAGGGGNAAADDGGGDGAGGEATADGDKAEGKNGTENDLQEIITEMNGQQGGDAAGGDSQDAKALQQEAAPGNIPAVAPGNTAAAPANAAPAAATAAAAPAKADAAPAVGNPPPFQPGGTPAGPGLPELGSKMAYVVEKGDTLARISQKVYGSNSRWKEMATLSGISNPSRIFPGDLVYYTLDESAVSFAKAYESIARSEEQVKAGDTLATIAQRIYGTTTAWRSLWRHNDKIDNPDIVAPGTTVYYVPKGAASAAVQMVKDANLAQVATSADSAKIINQLTVARAAQTSTVFTSTTATNVNHTTVNNANTINNSHSTTTYTSDFVTVGDSANDDFLTIGSAV